MTDITDYRPSESVLAHLAAVRVVGVIGPTGAGKTTIITQALKRNPSLYLVVTDTTRQPRPGEQDGVDYFFRQRSDMQACIANREYVNVAPILNGGDLYASHQDSYRADGIGLMALFAEVIPYFKSLPFKSFTSIFIVPSQYAVWRDRVGARGFTSEQLASRLAEAERSLSISLTLPGMLFVVNDDLDRAVQDFTELVVESTMKRPTDRQAIGRRYAEQFLATLRSELKL